MPPKARYGGGSSSGEKRRGYNVGDGGGDNKKGRKGGYDTNTNSGSSNGRKRMREI